MAANERTHWLNDLLLDTTHLIRQHVDDQHRDHDHEELVVDVHRSDPGRGDKHPKSSADR